MRLGVADRVMRQVAAAADDLEHRVRSREDRGFEALADPIVERAAAGAEDDLGRPAGNRPSLDGRRRDRQRRRRASRRPVRPFGRMPSKHSMPVRCETRRRRDRAARRPAPARASACPSGRRERPSRRERPARSANRCAARDALAPARQRPPGCQPGRGVRRHRPRMRGKARIDALAPRRLVRQDDARKPEMLRDGQSAASSRP